jgi:hypothetical protein
MWGPGGLSGKPVELQPGGAQAVRDPADCGSSHPTWSWHLVGQRSGGPRGGDADRMGIWQSHMELRSGGAQGAGSLVEWSSCSVGLWGGDLAGLCSFS